MRKQILDVFVVSEQTLLVKYLHSFYKTWNEWNHLWDIRDFDKIRVGM
jgi:hypothetical protein